MFCFKNVKVVYGPCCVWSACKNYMENIFIVFKCFIRKSKLFVRTSKLKFASTFGKYEQS